MRGGPAVAGEHAFGRHELEARIAQPCQQAVQGGLIDGSEAQERVAARQQPECFAAEGRGASLVEMASDPDLVAVHATMVGLVRRDRASRKTGLRRAVPLPKGGLGQDDPGVRT
jgi:hypothetical protein